MSHFGGQFASGQCGSAGALKDPVLPSLTGSSSLFALLLAVNVPPFLTVINRRKLFLVWQR